MHPSRVARDRLRRLTDLPNIGPAGARDLELLGIRAPGELVGADPLDLYRRLCAATGVRHDPCVLDVFLSVVDFMDGADPAPWWAYTARRKALLASLPPDAARAMGTSPDC